MENYCARRSEPRARKHAGSGCYAQTYSLSVRDPSSGLGTGPFGTVTVVENANGSLTFTESLLAGFRVHETTNGNHNAFYFSIVGNPNVTISSLTAGFTAVSTSNTTDASAPPFSDFYTAISCDSACGHGYGGGYAGQLTFTVASSSALTLASLRSTAYGGNSIYFASDLVNADDKTGNVGATLQVSAVPEPATWGMMLVGFAGVGTALRRRRRADALVAA